MTPSDQIPEGGERKPSDILSAAADLIEPEGRWTQGVYARRDGRQVAIQDIEDADCFCAVGAIKRITGGPVSGYLTDVLNGIGRRRGYDHVAAWNDAPERKQAEVVAALRQAAEKAREKGQ